MVEGRPSRTAFRVAMRRAAHALLDEPVVFRDPIAARILGDEVAAQLATAPEITSFPSLRRFVAVRSRFAEDHTGDGTVVILGAGLDTFAYRHPELDVYEIDHPATQTWKRSLLAAAGIEVPARTRFAAVDFETQTLDDAGLPRDLPAFFSWLGVVPYLTLAAFRKTVRWIAAMPAQSGVVFDYGLDPALVAPAERAARERLAARVAAAGEPFQLFFAPDALEAELRDAGFGHVEDLGTADIEARYGVKIAGSSAHLVYAHN